MTNSRYKLVIAKAGVENPELDFIYESEHETTLEAMESAEEHTPDGQAFGWRFDESGVHWDASSTITSDGLRAFIFYVPDMDNAQIRIQAIDVAKEWEPIHRAAKRILLHDNRWPLIQRILAYGLPIILMIGFCVNVEAPGSNAFSASGCVWVMIAIGFAIYGASFNRERRLLTKYESNIQGMKWFHEIQGAVVMDAVIADHERVANEMLKHELIIGFFGTFVWGFGNFLVFG